MKNLLVIYFLLVGVSLFSQTMEKTFGQVSFDELKMKSYVKDKQAKALVLYDKGKAIFFDKDNGYDIRFTRHRRVKIFDKSESENAEVSIPFYVDERGKRELVKAIEAYTYNYIDGKLTQKTLDPAYVYEERVNDRWRVKKFTFPDVQDGSVIEYKYVLETPFHFNLPDWTFQSKIPTVYSEYEVHMIPFYEYVFLVQGIAKFDYQNSVVSKQKRAWGSISKVYGQNVGNGVEFNDYVHQYVLKDIPAFKDESYISSINDYIIKMDFQLSKFYSPYGSETDIISTWPALNEALLKHEHFGKYIKKSSRFAKKIIEDELKLTGMSESQKAKEIITYIKNNFEWNDDNDKYASQSAKDFFNSKVGNAADINLFLIAMLEKAGIKTEPLILSTRNHGKIASSYPFNYYTNYVIAYVHTSSPFLADGSEDLLPFNILPIRCLNEKGLVVNEEDSPQWISLHNSIPSISSNNITLFLDTATLDLNAKISMQSLGFEAFANRKKFAEDTTKIKEYFTKKAGDIEKTDVYGYDQLNIPYTVNLTSKYETERVGNAIIVHPFLRLPLSENKLTQKERNYPVDFVYPWEDKFEFKLAIPNNFKVSSIPEEYDLDSELVKIKLDFIYSEGLFSAKGTYKFKKSSYSSEDYYKIKYHMDQIVKLFNQPILIEKL